MPGSAHHRDGIIASILFVVAGCVLRLAWLDSDLDYHSWVGYLTDEGRWFENARNFVLFGDLLFPFGNIHLWMAPLFQVVSYVAFVLFDISRFWARMFPALCGCGVLVTLWLCLRSRVNPYALAFGLGLLAPQEDLVMLSRVSIPEMPAMLLELCVFLALLKARDSVKGTLLAGGLMVICVAAKATTAPIFLIFGIVVWCVGSPETRGQRLLVFWGPALILGLVAVSAAFAMNLVSVAMFSDLTNVLSFVRLNNVYQMISFPFENALAPTVNVWMLGPWMGVLLWVLAPELYVQPIRRWFVGSAIWLGGYGLLIVLLAYYPDRYKVHALLPLAILIIFSGHIFSQLGLAGVQQRMISLSQTRRLLACAIVTLPWAVLLAPIVVWFASRLGLAGESLSLRIPLVVAAWLLLIPTLNKQGKNWIAMVVAPILAGLVWFAGHHMLDWTLWLAPASLGPLIRWVGVLGAATLVARLLGRATASSRGGRFALAAAVAYILVSVSPYGASLLWPQFTLRDASRDLGVFLTGETDIVSYRADGLFVDNRLAYKSHYLRGWGKGRWVEDPPRIVVSYELYQTPKDRQLNDFLEANYRAQRSYRVNVSSRYQPDPARVTIYSLIK